MTQAIILALVGFACFAFMLYALSFIKGIEKNGAETEGIVQEVDYNFSDKSYFPVIRFVTKDGEWVTKPYTLLVTAGILKPGKKISVVYDMQNPERYFVKLKANYPILIAMLIFAFGIMVYGLVKLLLL